MNEKNEQKDENLQESIVDLEVTGEQADQARGAEAGTFDQPEYKYVPVRRL
jgi:hypothetical protein